MTFFWTRFHDIICLLTSPRLCQHSPKSPFIIVFFQKPVVVLLSHHKVTSMCTLTPIFLRILCIRSTSQAT